MAFGVVEITILVAAIVSIIGAANAVSNSSSWVIGFIVFFVLMVVGDVSVDSLYGRLSEESNEWESGCVDPTSCICDRYFGIGSCDFYGGCSSSLSVEGNVQPTLVEKYTIPVKCYLGTFFGVSERACPFTYDEERCGPRDWWEGAGGDSPKTGLGREFALAGGFMCEPMVPWQCFFVFGILPTLVLFLFMQDMLSFGFFQPRLRKTIALSVAAISVLSGVFSDFVVEMVKITNLGAGPAFLSTILILGLLSSVLRIFTAGAEDTATGRLGMYEQERAGDLMEGVLKK